MRAGGRMPDRCIYGPAGKIVTVYIVKGVPERQEE